MKKILFVNACVRLQSRTLRLARRLLEGLEGEITELNLEREGLLPLTRETLARREALLAEGRLEDPMLRYARQFAEADEIVLAAPYWDLSFPAAVKTWLEHICVVGVSFRYDENDRPVGLCRAKRLIYVMTAGGPVFPPNHGYAYVRDLCATFYGIPRVELVCAEGLDLAGADPEAILRDAEASIRNLKLEQKE